ncbi:hypothetical protein C8R44DRAFT_728882 [Mycena epipterygia]|nr:hypothetical protein C8R44DRAFT_728882 [Mycena epipterygia]
MGLDSLVHKADASGSLVYLTPLETRLPPETAQIVDGLRHRSTPNAVGVIRHHRRRPFPSPVVYGSSQFPGVSINDAGAVAELRPRDRGVRINAPQTRKINPELWTLKKKREVLTWTEWRQGRAGSGAEPWDRHLPREITKEALICKVDSQEHRLSNSSRRRGTEEKGRLISSLHTGGRAKTYREICCPTQRRKWVPNPLRNRSPARPECTAALEESFALGLLREWSMVAVKCAIVIEREEVWLGGGVLMVSWLRKGGLEGATRNMDAMWWNVWHAREPGPKPAGDERGKSHCHNAIHHIARVFLVETS